MLVPLFKRNVYRNPLRRHAKYERDFMRCQFHLSLRRQCPIIDNNVLILMLLCLIATVNLESVLISTHKVVLHALLVNTMKFIFRQ